MKDAVFELFIGQLVTTNHACLHHGYNATRPRGTGTPIEGFHRAYQITAPPPNFLSVFCPLFPYLPYHANHPDLNPDYPDNPDNSDDSGNHVDQPDDHLD